MSSGSNPLGNASNNANQNMSPAPAGSPVAACGEPTAAEQNITPTKTHWISIKLVDEFGKGVPYEDFQITLPDGTVVEGSLDKRGLAKITGLDSGTCKVTFPNLDESAWKKQ